MDEEKRLSFDEISRRAAAQKDALRQEQAKRSPGSFNRHTVPDPIRASYGGYLRGLDDERFTALSRQLRDRRGDYEAERQTLSQKAEKSKYEEDRLAYLDSALTAEERLSAIRRNAPAADDEAGLDAMSGKARSVRVQANMLRHGEEALDDCLDKMNKLMWYSDLPEAEEQAFNRLYAETTALRSDLERLHEGALTVPTGDYENGKAVHRIDGTGYEPQILLGRLSSAEKTAKKQGGFESEFQDRRSDPLFTHLPSPEDVAQGRIGNCYMLASLTALAMQDPERIMEAIRDNGDTATVRFFNERKEPIYITVDKTVPVTKLDLGKATNGQKTGTLEQDAYGQGALWVQIIEKAYAQSGLHLGASDDAELGDYQPNYQDIISGNAQEFLNHFLGGDEKDLKPEEHLIRPEGSLGGASARNPLYSEAQMDFAEQVRDAVRAGKLVTAATLTTEDKQYAASHYLDAEKNITMLSAGVLTNHAYTVSDVIEGDDNRLYMALRNPHGGKGMLPDGAGQLHAEANANGYTLVELGAFREHFENQVYVSQIDLGPAAWQHRQETAELARKYTGTVRNLSEALLGSDTNRLKRLANSEKFEHFRDAAGRAAAALERDEPDRAEIDRSMKALFDAAKEYDERCVDKKHLDPATAKQNELERWKAAKATMLLADIYSGKNPAEDISLRKLGRDTGLVSTGYELARSAQASAEEKAQKLLHGMEAEKEQVSRQLSSFFDQKEHTRLDPNKLGGMTPAQQFEYLRRPENRAALESMLILAAHAEDAANSLTRAGKKLTMTQVSDMQKKSRHMAAFADGVLYSMDPPQYKADRVNSTPEAREFKTLGDRLKTAMTMLDGVEAKKTARLTMDRQRELNAQEDPAVQPPSVKAPQRGSPKL